MSEAASTMFQTSFNKSIEVRTKDHRLTSNGGLLLLREVDERLGLIERLAQRMVDPRQQHLIRYTLEELLREHVFSMAMGYQADDEVDLLAHDPAMRMATWGRPGERVLEERAASQPTQSRLIDIAANFKNNKEAIRRSLSESVEAHIRAAGNDRAVARGTLDIDSFPVATHGNQPGREYNGYYKDIVYHPLLASFAPEGDYDSKRLGDGFVHAVLRAGNVHTAKGAVRFIRTALDRCSTMARRLDVRFDAGFVNGPVMDMLTDDDVKFVGRIKKNAVLDRMALPYLTRPAGRPLKEGYEFTVELGLYHPQKETWKHPQRIVLVVVDKPDPKTGQLDLFPRYFFLITNWNAEEMSGLELLGHYRRRGTFEDRIGEFQNHIGNRLSYKRFEENEVALLLAMLAFNLLSVLRGELESTSSNGWDLGRVQRTALKVGARVTKGGRRLFVDVALSATALWRRIIKKMEHWVFPSKWDLPRGTRKRRWVAPPRHAHLQLVFKE